MLKKLFTLLLLLSPILAFSGCGDDDDNLEMVEAQFNTVDYTVRGDFIKELSQRDVIHLNFWQVKNDNFWLNVHKYHNGDKKLQFVNRIEMSGCNATYSEDNSIEKTKMYEYILKQEPSGICHLYITNSSIDCVPNGEYISEK